MKTRLNAVIGSCLLLALSGASLAESQNRHGKAPAEAPDESSFWIDAATGNQYYVALQQPPGDNVAGAKQAPVAPISLPGTVVPAREVHVGPRVTGHVVEVLVEEGSQVNPDMAAEANAIQGESTPAKENATARLAAARKVYEMTMVRLKNHQAKMDVEQVALWSRRWLEAQGELATGKEQQSSAVEAHLGRMRDLEKFAKNLATTGQGLEADAVAAEFHRLEAERVLAQTKGK
jgi:multidrug efflux pump subunit AcrA (membrane-fusion protein)